MEAKLKYEKLPEVVEVNGCGIPHLTAKLICRTDKKAIYYRWDDVWEVFRVRITEAEEAFGRSYPRREVYPGNEDFGATAWCYHGERAEKRARGMYERI